MPCRPKIQFDELLTWMQKNDCDFRELAVATGLDKMTLNRLARGDFKRLGRNVIAGVSRGTNGQVGEVQFTAFLARLMGRAS